MLAIIKTGGKQYLVKEGSKIKIEKLDKNIGDKILFDEVLLLSGENRSSLEVGSPLISGAKVEATISKQDRYKKVNTVKFKNKTHYQRTKNHKQYYTEVLIDKIEKI